VIKGIMDEEDSEQCWICFEDCDEKQHCKCNSYVHAKCLAQWQLHQGGKQEEHFCRFCKTELPDWRFILRPDYADCHQVASRIKYIIGNYQYESVIKQTMTKELFKQLLISRHGWRQVYCITFVFTVPGETKETYLSGFDAFDAAVFCSKVKRYDAILENKIRFQSLPSEKKRTLWKSFKKMFLHTR
jgi:hypothetical protein